MAIGNMGGRGKEGTKRKRKRKRGKEEKRKGKGLLLLAAAGVAVGLSVELTLGGGKFSCSAVLSHCVHCITIAAASVCPKKHWRKLKEGREEREVQ
jgi:hypothetical protein